MTVVKASHLSLKKVSVFGKMWNYLFDTTAHNEIMDDSVIWSFWERNERKSCSQVPKSCWKLVVLEEEGAVLKCLHTFGHEVCSEVVSSRIFHYVAAANFVHAKPCLIKVRCCPAHLAFRCLTAFQKIIDDWARGSAKRKPCNQL